MAHCILQRPGRVVRSCGLAIVLFHLAFASGCQQATGRANEKGSNKQDEVRRLPARVPQKFRVIRLETVGAASAYANDVNRHGVVVGWRPHPQLGKIAAAWKDGRLLDMGRLEHMASEAFAITDEGAIVGWCRRQDEHPRPFYFRNGVLTEPPRRKRFDATALFGSGPSRSAAGTATRGKSAAKAVFWDGTSAWHDKTTIEIPTGGRSSAAHAMNARGQVVGEVSLENGETKAFVWRSGGPVDVLPNLNGNVAKAYGINNDGVVVGGAYRNAQAFSAARWQDGKLQLLPSLGNAASSWSFDVNKQGWVVGWSTKEASSKQQFAVVWERDRVIDLNERIPQGYHLLLAKAVTNQGHIVAIGKQTADQFNTAFLLVPATLEVSPSESSATALAAKEKESKPEGKATAALDGQWAVDWLATAERRQGKSRQEMKFLSYLVPRNKILVFNKGSEIVATHCPLLSPPSTQRWPWPDGDTSRRILIVSEQLRLERLGPDILLVTEGDAAPVVYARDVAAQKTNSVALDRDTIADFLESNNTRMVRLTHRYDWSDISSESRQYLLSCLNRLEKQINQLKQRWDDKSREELSALQWRLQWVKRHCL